MARDITSQRLLAFSRRQVIHPTVVDLNQVLGQMETLLRRLIGEDVDLRLALAPDLGHVRTDPSQIEQVVMNLAVNARDAMPSGGTLMIETANVELDETYTRNHVGVEPGPYVRLSVTDTGTGMTPEVRARLFEPFFTTKPKGKGTGLGLATVYGIVEQNGGHIWVYTEPGHGTTFKIYLPRVDEPVDTIGRASPEVAEAGLGGSETILLVEDEDSVRALARQVLGRLSYAVVEAREGHEAIRLAAAHGPPTHLLVTDVVMPGLSGQEVAERLATIDPGV